MALDFVEFRLSVTKLLQFQAEIHGDQFSVRGFTNKSIRDMHIHFQISHVMGVYMVGVYRVGVYKMGVYTTQPTDLESMGSNG